MIARKRPGRAETRRGLAARPPSDRQIPPNTAIQTALRLRLQNASPTISSLLAQRALARAGSIA